MVCGLLQLEKELVGGSWFAWEMGWRIGMWWCMIKQKGDGNYEGRSNNMN